MNPFTYRNLTPFSAAINNSFLNIRIPLQNQYYFGPPWAHRLCEFILFLNSLDGLRESLITNNEERRIGGGTDILGKFLDFINIKTDDIAATPTTNRFGNLTAYFIQYYIYFSLCSGYGK